MADRSVPRPVGKPKFVPRNMRETPEDDEQDPKFVNPGFKRKIPELRKGAMGRRMKAKIFQAKNGTPHQQHMAHLKHQANVKNNPKKYG